MASFEPQDFDPTLPPPRPTTPPIRRGFVLVLLVLCFLAALVYGIPYVAERTGYAWEAGRAQAARQALANLDEAGVINRASQLFRMATVAVSPAVVNIQSRHFIRGNGPVAEGRQGETMEIGSGFIIDADNGYIVTNQHVVKGADRISVRLRDGNEVAARVVGEDPKTDLAVIQVRAELKVAAQWGDSDKLDIGDWVLAIGSPFMLDHTVTAGIISATGRNNLPLPNLDMEAYQDFLQTDAAINPGNSGGPLINLAGKVIGINTAIYASQRGGFEGIGLAIPSNLARPVVEGLIKQGRVIRGYLGIGIQDLTPDLARQLNVPKGTRGALVSHVQPDSPAAKAGIQAGDVVVKLGEKDVQDPASLRNHAARAQVGANVPIELYREGKRQTLTVTIGEQPPPPAVESLGFRLMPVPPDPRTHPQGMLVIDQVVAESPAFRVGLRPGMAIVGVGQTPVHTKDEYDKAAAAYKPEDGIPLQVMVPSGEVRTVVVSSRDRGPR
ncbi:MAG: trypsin-like peptidase domain-containing protein [Isosphaeraceae bacterium]|nr:trypsin-like peptidase domain-containing protein [Isosphaeraceae bacterium]